ncbi:sugar ABC transporter permease [Rhodoglobus aureus]|uniref:Sugar ABC transporter permease n=1 Tax=Rhodoglobus aureus TaxID=191497 RepID=A0ABP4GL52_9MICO
MSIEKSDDRIPDDSQVAAVVDQQQPLGGARKKARKWTTPLVLLAPAGIILSFVLVFPLIRLIFISFQDYGLTALFSGVIEWAGFGNYIAIFTDAQFLPVMWRTLWFTATLVLGCVVIGMCFAEMMVRLNRKMLVVFNFILIMAWAVPTVASTLIWRWLFDPVYGVINWMITQVGVFGDFTNHSWLGSQAGALFTIWLLKVWISVPFVALTVYAAQSQIHKEYYEAAMLDGANGWTIYRSVTLPFLRPVLYLVTILSMIWHFNTFNEIWILTQGGPDGDTTILSIWAFQKAFASNSFGQGAAIAVVTGIALLVLTAYYVRSLNRAGEQL